MNDKLEFRLLDTLSEQPLALPLLAQCFPEYWEQTAARNKEFPFEEISFGALLDGRIVGHCGVIPYRVSDGAGGVWLFGGIASVAVAPECRGQGIARRLCMRVREWASENGYASLPLYTGKDRVYESAGWSNYVSTPPRRIVFKANAAGECPVTGDRLDEETRRHFMRLYGLDDFPGKVLRGHNREFLGWPRIFNDPEMRFAWADGIAAIFFDGTLAECFAEPGVSNGGICSFISRFAVDKGIDCALHSQSRIWQALEACGCISQPCTKDVMHGEHPMALDLVSSRPHSRLLHYSLVDKF